MNERPDILPIVEQYVSLRRAGREVAGLCPFHADKNPSFFVNADSGLWHCFGCQEGGDVFSFVQKIDGCDFKTAVKKLGCETYRSDSETIRRKNEARQIAEWARSTSNRLRDALQEIGDRQRVCQMAGDMPDEEARLEREWALLCDLDDDLNNPALVLELWRNRHDIDALVEKLT